MMTETQVREKVKQLIVQVSSVPMEKIHDTSNFVEDLGLDSLALLEVGVAIDYEYKLDVPDEDLEQLATVQDAVDLVLSRVNAHQRAS